MTQNSFNTRPAETSIDSMYYFTISTLCIGPPPQEQLFIAKFYFYLLFCKEPFSIKCRCSEPFQLPLRLSQIKTKVQLDAFRKNVGFNHSLDWTWSDCQSLKIHCRADIDLHPFSESCQSSQNSQFQVSTGRQTDERLKRRKSRPGCMPNCPSANWGQSRT